MIRSEDSISEKYLTWDELGAGQRYSSEDDSSNQYLSYEYDWRRWSIRWTDSLINFSIENIKRSDLPEYTENLLQDQTSKEVVSGSEHVEEDWPLSCEVDTPWKGSSKDKDTDSLYVPKIFNILNLDPDNLVNVTLSFRGNITTYKTYQEPERNKFKVVGAAREDYYDPIQQKDEKDLIKEIIDSDIVIFDVTKSQQKLLEVWNVIRSLQKITEEGNERVKLTKNNKIKTFILLSSLMTWSNTPELFSDPEFKLHETYYGMRETHDEFKPMYLLENEFLQFGFQHRDWVRVLIVGTGLIYGPGEADLSPLLELSLNNRVELPIFGTGQNQVPVIHINDLIRFLNHIVRNFPENYEYVFAVEPEVVTQHFIIGVLYKSLSTSVHTRLVQCKNSLMYDLSEEDVFKLSANLPVDSSYQKVADWKNHYRFGQAMPPLVRRYFSIKRSVKPPCMIISGPENKRVKSICNHLSNLLGTTYLNRDTMLLLYMDYLATREGNQMKSTKMEKSLNNFTALPRGRDLIVLLHRIFLLPQIQKNGYILEGFPESYKEAKLLYDILQMISESDAQLFPDSNFDTNLFPDNHVVLHTNEVNMIIDMDSSPDEKGAQSTEMLFNLDNFRLKMRSENFSPEFFEEQNMLPLLYNIEEYQTDLECAKCIYQMIKPLKVSSGIKTIQSKMFSTPMLLNLMLINEKKIIPCKIKINSIAENDGQELKIELNTHWKCNEEQINMINEREDTDDGSELRSQCKHLSLKFAETNQTTDNKSEAPDKSYYQTAIFIDKVNKAVKGTEGNASLCCIKNIRPQINSIAASSSKGSGGLNLSLKRKSVERERERTSCREKFKHLTVKDDLIPTIEWTALSKKILKGVITGWCFSKRNLEDFSMDSSIDLPNLSESTKLCVKVSDTFTSESVSTFSSDLIRTNPLFKNSDIELYRNICMFISLTESPNYTVKVFNNFDLTDEIVFKECEMKNTNPKDIRLENLRKRDSKITPNIEEKRYKSVIRHGEYVQKLQRCCDKNEISNSEGKPNNPESENSHHLFDSSEKNEVAKSLNDTKKQIQSSSRESRVSDEIEPESNLNFIHLSCGCETNDDSSSNTDDQNDRRVSERSSSAKSILKSLTVGSIGKKSQSSFSRKVRFSAGDDNWSVKTFEEKFNSWLEAHMEELEENTSLKLHDPCSKNSSPESCSIYLFKTLLQKVGSDWRNEHLSSLLDPFNNRVRLVNFKDVQTYFEKFWFHFRSNPPHLTLLPTSLMVQLEKNYICDSVRWNQRKAIELLCDEQYKKTNPCVCNTDMKYDLLKDQEDFVTKKQIRDYLGAHSSFDIFEISSEKSGSVVSDAVSERRDKKVDIVYSDCKRIPSWDLIDENFGNHSLSNTSTTPFWNDNPIQNN